MESWFKTLKAEEVYLTEYEAIENVLKKTSLTLLRMFIKNRLHYSLGYFSPEEFEELSHRGQLGKHGLIRSRNCHKIPPNDGLQSRASLWFIEKLT